MISNLVYKHISVRFIFIFQQPEIESPRWDFIKYQNRRVHSCPFISRNHCAKEIERYRNEIQIYIKVMSKEVIRSHLNILQYE